MRKQDGLITRIVLIIIALVFVKYYFHFDIVAWYNSPVGQQYVGWVWNITKDFYLWVDHYVRTKWFS